MSDLRAEFHEAAAKFNEAHASFLRIRARRPGTPYSDQLYSARQAVISTIDAQAHRKIAQTGTSAPKTLK